MKKLFLILLFCFSFSAFADIVYIRLINVKRIDGVSEVYMAERPIYLIKKFLQNNTYAITEGGILICKYNNTIYISSIYEIVTDYNSD